MINSYVIANHIYSLLNPTLCFYRGFFFISLQFYSLYLTFFDGIYDGITLKVYSHTVRLMDAIRVKRAY